MSQLARTGVSWIRVDVSWGGGGPPSWWSDPVIRSAEAAGIHVDALLTDWNPILGSPSAVATFAREATQHLSPLGVDTYEIGNELNMGNSWGGPANAAQYTRDLKSAYRVIKSLNSSNTVLVGGLAPAATNGTDIAPLDFLRGMYASGAKGYFSAMNMHPYSFPDQPMQPDDWNAFYNLPRVHQLMVAHGDGAKKIWLTEYGAPTLGDPTGAGSVSESAQAQMVTGAYNQVKHWSWAGPVFVSNWADSADGAYGMKRADGSAKPALAAFVAANQG